MSASIHQYASEQEIRTLCEELSIPNTDAIIHAMQSWDAIWLKNDVEPHFLSLFSVETGEAAIKAIEAIPRENKSDGFDILAVYLSAARRSRENYTKLGISDQIFIDTMKAFARFTNEHMESFGRYGFDRGYWTYRQLSAVLFRLGTLEFEIRRLGKSAQWIAGTTSDSWALSVHIPSDARLSREEIVASYRMAAKFFVKKFPFAVNCPVYCDSWLLAPALKELLRDGSGILNFQSDYTIINENAADKSFYKWVYKRPYDRDEDLPETTSLARAIKARLLADGHVGSAFGTIKDFWKSFT